MIPQNGKNSAAATLLSSIGNDTCHPLLEAAQAGTVTLLFGAKDEVHNNAVALRDFLVAKLSKKK